MNSDFDDLADRLDLISEELADRAIELLKDAVREGLSSRPAAEKQLTQARRAIEKASHLLRGDADGD